MEPARFTLKRVAKATALFALGNLPGFLIPILLARRAGANRETDALFVALSLSSFVTYIFASVAETANIPFLVQIRAEGGGLRAYCFRVGLILSSASAGVVAVLASLVIGGGHLVGWEASYIRQIALILSFMVPFAFLAAASSVLKGVLISLDRLGLAMLSTAMTPVVVVLTVVLSPMEWLIPCTALAFAVGELAKFLLLSGSAPIRNLPRGSATGSQGAILPVNSFLKAAFYQAAGLVFLSLCPIVDRMVASSQGVGSVSLLSYAERMWQVPIGVLTGGMLPVLLVSLSNQVSAARDLERLSRDTARIARIIFLVACLLCFPLYFLRHQLFSSLFWGSALKAESVRELSSVFLCLVAGLPLFSAGLAYTRLLMVLKRNDLLMLVGFGELIAKLCLNAVLIGPFKLVGLALATSGMYSLGAFALVLVCRWCLRSGLRVEIGNAASKSSI